MPSSSDTNNKLEYTKVVLNQDFPSWADRDFVIHFFHETMKPYHDSLDDVARALDYALVPERGQGGFVMLAHRGELLLGALCMLKTGMGGYIPENLLLFVTVAPESRGQGVGRQLFTAIEPSLSQSESYCIPRDHLFDFYGRAGFKVIDRREAPPFLSTRLASYIDEGLPVAIMHRPKGEAN